MNIIPGPNDVHGYAEAANKNHVNVIDCCPAEMNGEKGWLGVSRAVWCRVWFDVGRASTTLFTSMRRADAVARFNELKAKYGT